jgi:uncharacterized protein DUF2631
MRVQNQGVALNPHSEEPDLGAPEDYAAHHPTEHPEDWGWHGEWGRTARVGGWIVAIILVVMITATHYNHSGTGWLLLFAFSLILMLGWDAHRRKNAWRK